MKKDINGRRVSGSYRFVGEWQTRPTRPEMRRVRPNNNNPESPETETNPVKV